MDNLNQETLGRVFRRLRKDTKGFSALIVRDPLDFLDFELNLGRNIDSLIFDIGSGRYHPQKPYAHPSPKDKGINRETVVFDVRDALVYRFCIEQIDTTLLNKTPQHNVRGGIKITPKPDVDDGDFYEKWFADWKEHMDSIEEGLEERPFLANTDIASYFENINILVLKDMVRSDVKGKSKLLNLLFYFLENIQPRVDYEVNTFTGLPQEDINCSRILAYYFLHPHDDAMAEFCPENDAEFYRFVDDMSFAVNSEVVGKKALKRTTESLRRLNLVASIEKTSILDSETARRELFLQENKQLSEFEDELLNGLENHSDISGTVRQIEEYYSELQAERKHKLKSWTKVLKRFYTLFTYAQSPMFLGQLEGDIVRYPALFVGNKVGKYLIRNRQNEGFERSLVALVEYLYSQENLYPAVESNLLETFLLFDPGDLGDHVKERFKTLCNDLFFKNRYRPLSDYARAVSCLLFFRFDTGGLSKIANHYVRSSEDDFLLRKYMILVSLTVSNDRRRKEVINKARREQHISVSRLVSFIENLSGHKTAKAVKRFLKERNKIYICSRKKDRRVFSIVESYPNVRSEVLRELVAIYG